MAINFPNNPNENDFHTVGNIQYVYLNGKWQVNAGLVSAASALGELTDVTITNVDSDQTIVWNGSGWVNGEAAAGATGGGSDKLFWENDQVINTDYTITSGKNAMTAGPIIIADGVTVTIPDSSSWTIV